MKTLHDADAVLLAWLQASDEAERQRLQAELLLEHAAPIIRQTLRVRLRGEMSAPVPAFEADDLFNEVYIRLMERLRELRRQPEKPIRNFLVYVARVTTNVCHDVLREKKPKRHLLKHKLRNLLSRHPDFTVWPGEHQALLCGLTSWNQRLGTGAPNLTEPSIEEMIDRLRTEVFARQNPAAVPLSQLAYETLVMADQAIELNALAHIIASLQGLRERKTESLDDSESRLSGRLPDATPLTDARLEGRENLSELWEEIKRLSLTQRQAICFGTEDTSGEDLVSVLVGTGIATVSEIAAQMGMGNEEFGELWLRLPLSDNQELAVALGVSRTQASLCRFRAQRYLRKRLSAMKNKLFAR